jgi:5'-nucleotidase
MNHFWSAAVKPILEAVDPEVIVEIGVNFGDNTRNILQMSGGHAVLHSGTVGAALTAADAGCRAIAVSLNVLPTGGVSIDGAAMSAEMLAAMVARGEPHRNWDGAADLAVALLKSLADTPPGTVLNLNVPASARFR